MDNKKIAEMLFKLQMDDLRDADMLADYAKQIADMGDAAISSMLYARSKARLSQMTENQRHVDNVMERVREECEAMGEAWNPDAIYHDLYGAYIEGWTEKIKHKLEKM